MIRIGFIVNPVAGMGGKVGLKGTDGVVEEARKRGATERAEGRADIAIKRLAEAYTRHRTDTEVHWLTPSRSMGEDILMRDRVPQWTIEVIADHGEITTAEDTRSFVKKAVKMGIDLLVFCGGDGTARDVFSAAGPEQTMFGIPSGVKMHSGIFAIDPRTGGELLEFFIRGEMTTGEGEIMDLDEERYRKGEWNIALFGIARTLYEPSFIQMGKFMVEEATVEDYISEIVEHMEEEMEEETGSIYILGPGGTLESIGKGIDIDKTHLGVDIVMGGKLVAKDCAEKNILSELERLDAGKGHDRTAYIVVSPIGGQGFFLGRGNLQLSPAVVRRVGIDNIMVVSVPQKLERTKVLRVDTGDQDLDEEIRAKGSVKVLMGYRTFQMKKLG